MMKNTFIRIAYSVPAPACGIIGRAFKKGLIEQSTSPVSSRY